MNEPFPLHSGQRVIHQQCLRPAHSWRLSFATVTAVHPASRRVSIRRDGEARAVTVAISDLCPADASEAELIATWPFWFVGFARAIHRLTARGLATVTLADLRAVNLAIRAEDSTALTAALGPFADALLSPRPAWLDAATHEQVERAALLGDAHSARALLLAALHDGGTIDVMTLEPVRPLPPVALAPLAA